MEISTSWTLGNVSSVNPVKHCGLWCILQVLTQTWLFEHLTDHTQDFLLKECILGKSVSAQCARCVQWDLERFYRQGLHLLSHERVFWYVKKGLSLSWSCYLSRERCGKGKNEASAVYIMALFSRLFRGSPLRWHFETLGVTLAYSGEVWQPGSLERDEAWSLYWKLWRERWQSKVSPAFSTLCFHTHCLWEQYGLHSFERFKWQNSAKSAKLCYIIKFRVN